MPGIARSLIVIVIACLRKVRTGNPMEGLDEETHLSSVAWPFNSAKDWEGGQAAGQALVYSS